MDSYRNPKPTVDVVILLPDDSIVFVKRKNPPHGWALPGGFVNEGESYEDAARREAKEETGLDVQLIEQFHTYSDPKRDPRQHIATTVYTARAEGWPVAGDDAAEVAMVDPYQPGALDELVFDHAKIVRDVFTYLNLGRRPKL